MPNDIIYPGCCWRCWTFTEDNEAFATEGITSAVIKCIETKCTTFQTPCMEQQRHKRILVVGLAAGKIEMWDTQHEELKSQTQAHGDDITCLSINENGSMLISGSADFSLNLWRIQEDHGLKLLHNLIGHTGKVTHVAFFDSGTRIVSAAADPRVEY